MLIASKKGLTFYLRWGIINIVVKVFGGNCDGFCEYMRYAEMVEWSIAAVLKTVECKSSGGSNPSLRANEAPTRVLFCFNFRFAIEISFYIWYTTVSKQSKGRVEVW